MYSERITILSTSSNFEFLTQLVFQGRLSAIVSLLWTQHEQAAMGLKLFLLLENRFARKLTAIVRQYSFPPSRKSPANSYEVVVTKLTQVGFQLISVHPIIQIWPPRITASSPL